MLLTSTFLFSVKRHARKSERWRTGRGEGRRPSMLPGGDSRHAAAKRSRLVVATIKSSSAYANGIGGRLVAFLHDLPIADPIANYGYIAIFLIVTLESAGLPCPGRQRC